MSRLINRRRFLGSANCAALGSLGIFNTLVNLKLIGNAVAAPPAGPGDYRAMVCLFLHGGNDSYNLLAPTSVTEHANYLAIRSNLALPAPGSGSPTALLPLNSTNTPGRTFGVHHAMPQLQQLFNSGKAAFVMHWKSLRRQIRVRGLVSREEGPQADAYYASRSLQSRLGAWASEQSQPLTSRGALMAEVAKITLTHGPNPKRPPFWGGFRIQPLEVEFWADGAFRLHDRFRWTRGSPSEGWEIQRLNP